MGELERFKKEINLAALATAYGYVLDRKESSRASWVMRHPDGDKIIVSTGQDGHGVFFSVRENASGSVIDFIMHRRGLSLGQARKALREWISFPTAQNFSGESELRRPIPIEKSRMVLVLEWNRSAPYSGGYLENRGICRETIQAFAKRLRVDLRGNVLFRHDDLSGLCGWEVKSYGFTGFSSGGCKGLFANPVGVPRGEAPKRLVVAESAIDAMSFYQCQPDSGLYLSFGGSLSSKQKDLLHRVLTKYPMAEVIAATDRDEEGERFSDLIRKSRSDVLRVLPPNGKDWNDWVMG